jgi:hypothetical protein
MTSDEDFLDILQRLSKALGEVAGHLESDWSRGAVRGVVEALDEAAWRAEKKVAEHKQCFGVGCEDCNWLGYWDV